MLIFLYFIVLYIFYVKQISKAMILMFGVGFFLSILISVLSIVMYGTSNLVCFQHLDGSEELLSLHIGHHTNLLPDFCCPGVGKRPSVGERE